MREYLIEGGMRRLHVSFGSNLEGMCHDILGRTCVNYMSIAASDLPPAGMLGRCLPGFRTRRSERLKAHPLSVYVHINVVRHAELAQFHGVCQTSFVQSFSVELMTKLNNLLEDKMMYRYLSSTSKEYIFASSNAPHLLQLYFASKRVENDNERNIATRRLLTFESASRSFQGEYHGSALQAAVINKDVNCAKVLLNNGADVDELGTKWHTALQIAASLNASDIVRLLVEAGADVNLQGGICDTALKAAVSYGSIGIIRYLLEHGADIHAVGYGRNNGGPYYTALQAAALRGDANVTKLLLERGADASVQGE